MSEHCTRQAGIEQNMSKYHGYIYWKIMSALADLHQLEYACNTMNNFNYLNLNIQCTRMV